MQKKRMLQYLGSKVDVDPSASSTSALPHADELALLPCCTTSKDQHQRDRPAQHLNPNWMI
jgi:hypothetical protein